MKFKALVFLMVSIVIHSINASVKDLSVKDLLNNYKAAVEQNNNQNELNALLQLQQHAAARMDEAFDTLLRPSGLNRQFIVQRIQALSAGQDVARVPQAPQAPQVPEGHVSISKEEHDKLKALAQKTERLEAELKQLRDETQGHERLRSENEDLARQLETLKTQLQVAQQVQQQVASAAAAQALEAPQAPAAPAAPRAPAAPSADELFKKFRRVEQQEKKLEQEVKVKKEQRAAGAPSAEDIKAAREKLRARQQQAPAQQEDIDQKIQGLIVRFNQLKEDKKIKETEKQDIAFFLVELNQLKARGVEQDKVDSYETFNKLFNLLNKGFRQPADYTMYKAMVRRLKIAEDSD